MPRGRLDVVPHLGGEEVLESVCQKLSVRPGQNSADGKITVEFAECIGVCEGAPAVLINDEGRGNVTPDRDFLLYWRPTKKACRASV